MRRFWQSPTRYLGAANLRFRKPTHNFRRVTAQRILSEALKELEVTWSRRSLEQTYQLLDAFKNSKAGLFNRSQEEQARLRNHFQEILKSITEETAVLLKDLGTQQERDVMKVQELVSQNHMLLHTALEEKTETMKLEGKYNIRGALERIVYQAKLRRKVPPTAGIQPGLAMIAKSKEFTTILQQEVDARKLDVMDVMVCIDTLYEEISNRTIGNDNIYLDIIFVRTNKFNAHERAALVVFLRIQDNWQNRLDWRECCIM